jgi:AcrR family transcriptional regulator
MAREYRTVCFLHEACQIRRNSKGEVLEPLSLHCLWIDQGRAAQRRCNCSLATIILSACKKRLAENHAVRFTAAMRKSISRKNSAAALAAADDESARGRLLSAATRLFCKNGINATGIDAIINEAGTAKTTLYKLFGSKTNLVHAVLENEGRQWREWFIGAIEAGGGEPEKKLARIFPALKSWFGEERFYGCPFINAVAEHDKDQKQFRNVALKHKKVVLSHIEQLAREMGAAQPGVLAHQLGLLIDGAIVAAMVSRDPAVADTAGLAACSLFAPSKAKKPKRAAAVAELAAV